MHVAIKTAVLAGLYVLCAASSAHAARKFVTGFEFCTFDASSQYIFDSVAGTPTMMTTGARSLYCAPGFEDRGKTCTTNSDCGGECYSDPDNTCYLQLNDGDSLTLGLDYFGSSATLYEHLLIRVDTVGATNAEFLLFKESANKGAFLKLVRENATTYRYDLYYRDTNTECNGGTNDGTECTPCDEDADCTAGICVNAGGTPSLGACTDECTADTDGEQWCIDSAVGSSPSLTAGRWYEVVPGQDNSVGTSAQTQLELWEGGFQRGLRTRTESPDPGSVTSLVLQVPTSSGWVVSVDDKVIDDAVTTGMTMLRVAQMDPVTPDGTTELSHSGSCTAGTHYDCVDDLAGGGSHDSGASLVSDGAGATDTSDSLALSNITLGTGEAIYSGVGISTVVVAKDAAAGGGDDQYVYGCIDGATCASFSDIAQESSYVAAGYNLTVSASYDTITEINAASFRARIDTLSGPGGGCATSCPTDITAAVAEVEIQTPSPTKPGIAQDVNGDGVKTLCPVGDSTVNNAQLHSTLVSDLVDFDNVIFYTRGSRTEADVENQILDLMDGQTGGVMNGTVAKGSSAPCDYVVLVSGINTVVGLSPARESYCNGGTNHGKCCGANCTSPAAVTCTGGTCQYYTTGYCRGGTDHGSPCACPRNASYATASGGGFTTYCLNNKTSGAVWLSSATTTCDTCASNADCETNVPCTVDADCGTATCSAFLGNTCVIGGQLSNATCAANADCAITCSGGQCRAPCIGSICVHGGGTSNAFARADRPIQPSWKQPGCTGLDECSDGLCLAGNTVAEFERSLRVILDAVDNRQCNTTCDGNGNISCSTNADCAVEIILAPQPRPVAKSSGVFAAFLAHERDGESIATMQTNIAVAENRHLIDLNAAFVARCAEACGSEIACHGDEIHWSACGIRVASDLITECFTNANGTADGACPSGTCTAGNVGNTCGGNADCNLYNCAF